jgi:hypothetical protein
MIRGVEIDVAEPLAVRDGEMPPYPLDCTGTRDRQEAGMSLWTIDGRLPALRSGSECPSYRRPAASSRYALLRFAV